MTILLVGVGIIFSIRFSFRYQWKIAFNFKNTFAKIGAKGEGEGTVSGFRAACTALANTVGTGNISGVATAIVSGGPGALVWMWVSAFFGMSTKACEKSVNYAFGDTERNRKMMPIYIVYFMLPCVIFYNIEAEALWAFTDILSALYVCITVFIIVAKRKEIFRLFDDFWNRYLPAKEAGENPPYVTFDCKEQD
ncbi:MAG: alanine:cation symporter family protein [Lachnospiraceae bacterium]|uniref:alanine:cation symporter family protein n=1 Tax=Sarcina sp. DSM 11001 TaxID=1798184 RepID=UPI00088CD7E2|nr:alanine:cation symporter family protein [Sarcina sp. DSM 11001]MEE1041256.1 alanine:cation symporter family protein [Lachnospiraceae bacterium]SDL95204.1 Sodium:alanine symporter family protein [Sarcina sp. DSM 11001]